MKKIAGKIFVPLAWTIFIEILLCLPGNALPNEAGIGIPNIDKVAHVIIFGAFVGFWCFYFSRKIQEHEKLKVVFFCIFIAAAVNGIAIEYIQKYFIPNRSFDQGDIIADLLSAGIGYGVCNVRLLTCAGRTPSRID